MHKNIFSVLILTLQGCWFAPEPVYIEFDNHSNIIEVLSEDYFIKKITIAEYIQEQGSIRLVDSSSVIIEQKGDRVTRTVCILKPDEHYFIHRNAQNALLTKKHLCYKIQLEKFKNEKKDNPSDMKTISFVKDETVAKKKYN
jgi:hypothetical protein